MAMVRRESDQKTSNWRREQDFIRAERAARDARHERLRELIRAYERAGRDWRSPERVALEDALRVHGEAVACDGSVWGYSRVERSIYRRRALPRPHAADPAPRLPRVYRCGWDRVSRPDLAEMSPEAVEG